MGQPVVHFEFWSRDPGTISAFYKQIFDWQINDIPDLKYWMIDTGSKEGIGGGMFEPQEGPLPAQIALYIQVDDIGVYLAKVEAQGGKVIVPEMEIQGVGWSAIFLDPEQRAVGLFKPLVADAG